MMPHKRIEENDLRRRVYRVATLLRNETGLFCHESLKNDQVHLLTDDRYNRVKDFISIALEKGILEKKGDFLHKDSSKFSSPYDFHRARIDNPIEVMANAVEPLKSLQRIVRRIAWLPAFWLRRQIAEQLLRKTNVEFENDYQAYFIEGETKEKNVGTPFLIKGKRRKLGVVLIHGYMAAPLEVKELALYLSRKGLWVYAPRVKGHGTSPEDLATRSYQHWTDSVDDGYAIIQNLCKRVVVGGFSNGAGLALDLASRVNGIDGVFAVCPPLRLQDISSKLVPAVDVWNRLMSRVRLDDARKEFVENDPENPHINYLRNPISGVKELERLMDTVERKLTHIKMPALVIQSHGDPVVNPKGSKRIFDNLGSVNKTYILFNFGRHGILLGEGAQRVHRVIGDFIAIL